MTASTDRLDLRSAYISKHMSRRQAAKAIGVPEATLRRYEKGDNLHPESAGKVAAFLGVDILELPQFAPKPEGSAA